MACGTVYIDEKDASGWEHLIAVQDAVQGAGSTTIPPAAPNETKDREPVNEGKWRDPTPTHVRKLLYISPLSS